MIGSRVGEGNGRVAAAAAGAAVGALVGNQLANRDRDDEYAEREVRRCRTVDNWESRVAGYRVAYEYQGRAYTTILPYDPGSATARSGERRAGGRRRNVGVGEPCRPMARAGLRVELSSAMIGTMSLITFKRTLAAALALVLRRVSVSRLRPQGSGGCAIQMDRMASPLTGWPSAA